MYKEEYFTTKEKAIEFAEKNNIKNYFIKKAELIAEGYELIYSTKEK